MSLSYVLRFIFCLLIAVGGASTRAEEDLYGRIFIGEEHEKQPSHFSVTGGLQHEWTNAFYDVWGYDLSLRYHWHSFFGAAVSFEKFFPDLNQQGQNLERVLADRSSEFIVDGPEQAWGADFRVVPLSGRLNFANRSTVPFDLVVSLGPAFTRTILEKNYFGLRLGLGFEQMVLESVGFSLQVRQTFNRWFSSSGQNRFAGYLGVIYRI